MSAEARDDRTPELEELVVRPGTYFNPQTEVVVIVDDSTSIDQSVFNMEAYEGADWVRISDEVPVDENALEEAMEEFQTHSHAGATPISPVALEAEVDSDVLEEEPEEDEPVIEGEAE